MESNVQRSGSAELRCAASRSGILSLSRCGSEQESGCSSRYKHQCLRTNASDKRHVGECWLREAAPGVPPRLVPELVDQVVVVCVGQITGKEHDVRLVRLQLGSG